MAVKYVKDFAFDSGFGYTGSAGQTPVRGYNRGGKVFDNSIRNPISKFPDLAPAMVGKGPGKMGGKTSDVAPMSTAKANPQIAKYAKGGKVKKPMKKADGGAISPLRRLADQPIGVAPEPNDRIMPMPETESISPLPYSEPIYEFGRPVNELINVREAPPPLPGPEALVPPPLQQLEEMPFTPRESGPRMERWSDGTYHFRPEESGQRTPLSALPDYYRRKSEEALASKPAMPTKADRRDMRRDRMSQARDIMDRYIAGPRTMMTQPRRRAMPVTPSAPMIDRSIPQPTMMRNPRSPEIGMFAKGGKVTKGERKIGKVMGEYKRGELHSGSKKGPVVTNPKQAKAIALSEARAAGAKIPKKAMGGKACG
jgi:hypothetical protein